MKTKTLVISSFHRTLALAVAAVQPDLSYNPRVAAQSIRDIDSGYGKPGEGAPFAFTLTGSPEIYYGCQYDGAVFLNEFDPFSSCMDDSVLTELVIVDRWDAKFLRVENDSRISRGIRGWRSAAKGKLWASASLIAKLNAIVG